MPISDFDISEIALGRVPEYGHASSEPENPFSKLISDQKIITIPSFTLESGVTLREVPVAYKTSGRLNDKGDNAMLICHALTGSADVEDCLGSPYGTASPCTLNPETGRIYGPEFPLTTVRDDVSLHKLVLDFLGIRQIAVAIGGSMGGMLVLEWAYFGKDYVRAIVPLATSSRHSAWCISWGEAQRQSIYSDPKYEDGYYAFEDPPSAGLGAARMSALLTYRSRNSFESRFGRNIPDPIRYPHINSQAQRPPTTPSEEHWAVHNEGFRGAKRPAVSPGNSVAEGLPTPGSIDLERGEKEISPGPPPGLLKKRATTYFSAQCYLRYQGEKFVKRFDANCYIAITRKLDTHDVSRGRTNGDVAAALRMIEQPALVIGIESDGLFTYAEQQELAEHIPDARLATIDSPEGHDAFLLQFEEVNTLVVDFLKDVLPDIMSGSPMPDASGLGGYGVVKPVRTTSVGEVDDIISW